MSAPVSRLLARLVTSVALTSTLSGGAHAETLECDGLRRLSDNALLDLQVRMVFDRAGRHYRRYENTGRGWEAVGVVGQASPGPGARILLDQNRFVTHYVERLSGAYYYIDRSGVTLSLWGHCASAPLPQPEF